MTDKPLELKSPDNAMALGLYLTIALLAIAVLLNPIGSPVLAHFFAGRAILAAGWGLLMLFSASVGLASAIIAPRLSRPRRALSVEATGAIGVAATVGTYVVALSMAPTATVLGLVIFVGFTLAAAGRAAQLIKELRLIRIAQQKKITATLESLADPRPER